MGQRKEGIVGQFSVEHIVLFAHFLDYQVQILNRLDDLLPSSVLGLEFEC